MAANDGRFLDDAASLRALVEQMPRGAQQEYKEFKALDLESGFPNRRMVVYTLDGTEPVNISKLLLGDMEMTRAGGPSITITDEQGTVQVGVSPKKWRDRHLFLHIPQNFIFKWKGKDTGAKGVHFVPHYAILIKTRSKEHHQIDGDTYCATWNKFAERFPDVTITY